MKQSMLSVEKSNAMDEAFFERALREAFKNETITRVKILEKGPAVGKGENFLSDLLRMTVEYFFKPEGQQSLRKDVIRLIAKLEPTTDSAGTRLINEQQLFKTELKVFKNILPDIEKLLDKSLSPRFLCGTEDPGIIIMEDMTLLGFVKKNRLLGLSLDHVLIVLQYIAEFHAASVHMCERNPSLVRSFTNGIMTKNTPRNMFRIFEQSLLKVSHRVRTWSEPRFSRIADKLLLLIEKFEEEIVAVTNYDEDEFCVLNHGDCWVNNILFREDASGKPLRVILLDYQMSVYSSPVIDLVHFLGVCPERSLQGTENDRFYKEYLRKLTETMSRLGCKTRAPSFEDLRRATLKRRMWSVLGCLMLYPRMIVDASETEAFDDILASGITNMDVFTNPDATTYLKKILPLMEDRGFFD